MPAPQPILSQLSTWAVALVSFTQKLYKFTKNVLKLYGPHLTHSFKSSHFLFQFTVYLFKFNSVSHLNKAEKPRLCRTKTGPVESLCIDWARAYVNQQNKFWKEKTSYCQRTILTRSSNDYSRENPFFVAALAWQNILSNILVNLKKKFMCYCLSTSLSCASLQHLIDARCLNLTVH